MAHKLNNFGTKFIKLKFEEDELEGKIKSCLAFKFQIFKNVYLSLTRNHSRRHLCSKMFGRRTTTEKGKIISSSGEDFTSPLVLCENNLKPVTTKPHHTMSEWLEPVTTTKRLTVAILPPSGVYFGQFLVRVLKDGWALKFVLSRSDPLTDLNMLQCKWFLLKGANKIEK